jgi:hypothetical protein
MSHRSGHQEQNTENSRFNGPEMQANWGLYHQQPVNNIWQNYIGKGTNSSTSFMNFRSAIELIIEKNSLGENIQHKQTNWLLYLKRRSGQYRQDRDPLCSQGKLHLIGQYTFLSYNCQIKKHMLTTSRLESQPTHDEHNGLYYAFYEHEKYWNRSEVIIR